MKRKVCVVTGTRAEYGLLYWTMLELKNSSKIEMQLVVTGMHLSPEFGLTYQRIEEDGFSINKKVEMILSSDTNQGITKSIGLGVIGFADVFEELKPDLVLVLGDRYEILAATTAAMIAKIPVAHCHGGEATEGLIDEPIRHSITKMSHIHFTSTEDYAKRVIQLGENPKYVFNVGALGIENINRLNLLSKEELEKSIDFKLGDKSILVTFHPVTLDHSSAQIQFDALLKALDEFKDLNIVFTLPNADTNGRIIIDMIKEYVDKNPTRCAEYISLGQLRYLSAVKHVNAVVGNSSSGLLEVPSLGTYTVNIGDRQQGRVKGKSVIDCEPKAEEIKSALMKVLSYNSKSEHPNPYGNSNSSETIVPILETIDLENIIKKKFYNL